MKLKILGDEKLEEPESEVFVSLEADDESGISVMFHVNGLPIEIAWISQRGKIIMTSLTRPKESLLRDVGFRVVNALVMVEK